MPKKKRVTDTVFARGVAHLADTINEIDDVHGIAPAELTRRLLEAACQFYRDNGWFSFPVLIEPLAFQAKFVAEAEDKLKRRGKGGRGGEKPDGPSKG